MDGWMLKAPKPIRQGGVGVSSGGQLGFSATRQLVQALLLFFPSREERQANKNLLLGLKRPLRKPDQSGAWQHQVSPCAGCAFLFSPNWWGGCQPHSWGCKLAPDPVRSQQGSSRVPPYQGQLFALLLRFCLRCLQLLLGL